MADILTITVANTNAIAVPYPGTVPYARSEAH
jgi:hypothetical protein